MLSEYNLSVRRGSLLLNYPKHSYQVSKSRNLFEHLGGSDSTNQARYHRHRTYQDTLHESSRWKDCKDVFGIISNLPYGPRLDRQLVAWTRQRLREYEPLISRTNASTMSSCSCKFHEHHKPVLISYKQSSVEYTKFCRRGPSPRSLLA